MTEDEFDELMDYLEEIGAVKKTYDPEIDEQPLYKFNMDVLQAYAPEVYELLMEELDNELLHLYKLGLVDIEYDENLTAKFYINERGKEFAQTGIIPEIDEDLL